MGKKQKKDSKQQSAPLQCTCTDFYRCACGNRPERPSRGHKWDPQGQAWVGKGHKQKGASGQTASLGQAAKTTAVGNTTVAQWQRLPSQLLKEVLQRQKRPPAKYKNLESKGFKYRVIVPDVKDAKKDLFFVPAQPVANEEQAKEEAALLALLHLTPSLPHERKLPDPYKTTWLNAIENIKKEAGRGGKNDNKAKSNDDAATANNKETAASSSNLTLGNAYTSQADRQAQLAEKKRQRNARIRRHEAVRMANQNHPVFLSAQLRQQIEALLRGDETVLAGLEEADEEEEEEPVELDDVQLYVEQRLRGEGFTKRQARAAWNEANTAKATDEEEWDTVYESCLQWLLVHLNEDQLPEGFDPRGRTLDVIAPTANTTKASASATPGNETKQFAKRFGISFQEVASVEQRAAKNGGSLREAFWSLLQDTAGILPVTSSASPREHQQANLEAIQEELEVLDAIFASDCQVERDSGSSTMTIVIPETDGLTLKLTIQDKDYPSHARPSPVLLYGDQRPFPNDKTVALYMEILKFWQDLPLGQPMVFDLYNHVQALLQEGLDSLESKTLVGVASSSPPSKPVSKLKQNTTTTGKSNNNDKLKPSSSTPSRPAKRRRPRERGPFWSTPPAKTPPATPFPPNALKSARQSLPAAAARSEFLSKLETANAGGRVLLVTGDTGCGKTTQIPQFILEENPSSCKIVVAQPRRLAATGVAARVASERGEAQPGKASVGHVVRGDSALCASSRLVFCTTGVLLRQLQCEGALDNITHIVVDEVHERHLDTDILLGLLKQQFLPSCSHLTVVLMSATLDADRFAGYWGKPAAPRMHIPGRTFPVTDYTLEDVLRLTRYIPSKKGKRGQVAARDDYEEDGPGPGPAEEEEEEETLASGSDLGDMIGGMPVDDLVKRVDQSSVDYNLLGQLVKQLVLDKDSKDDGSILIFMSGAPEINQAIEAIKKATKALNVLLLPLHGGLQPKEQSTVFASAPCGMTKIVVSTNICETSVTIPDCTIVIDSAREKQASYDPGNRMPLLLERFASKASLKQRRGRAGRVRSGVCYKLISQSTLSKLPEHATPEIQRCALDQAMLSLLYLGVQGGKDDPSTFFSSLLDPPSAASLQAATTSLLQLGAVEAIDADKVRLTPLGMHMAGIPAPPSIGKMLVMGAILGCRSAAVAMAASMSVGRSPFIRIDMPRNNRKQRSGDNETESMEEMKSKRILEERKKLFETVGGNSDHALLALVYTQFQATGAGSGGRKRFCESLGLSFPGMREMAQNANQLDGALAAVGYADTTAANSHANSWRIIRACAVASMAPGQLVKVVRPATTYHETAEGAREKDGQAKQLKFFVQTDENKEERVFIHPSSFNFSTGSYPCPWLVYHTLIRTSKPFLRDVTECSAYALLLFGGPLAVQASSNTIVVNDWVKLSANARIGALVGGLRQRVDDLLMLKVQDPLLALEATREMKLIVKLLKTDGLGT